MELSKSSLFFLLMRNLGGVAWAVRWSMSDLRVLYSAFNTYVDQELTATVNEEDDSLVFSYVFEAPSRFTVRETCQIIDQHRDFFHDFFTEAARYFLPFFGRIKSTMLVDGHAETPITYMDFVRIGQTYDEEGNQVES